MRTIGQEAENNALRFLKKKGFKLITQNYRSKIGEIDLIGLLEETLIFVEVKMRNRADFGGACFSLTQKQKYRIQNTAAYFIQKSKELAQYPYRFDVILFESGHIEWIPNAF